MRIQLSLAIWAMLWASSSQAKSFKGIGLGVKGGALLGCMSAAGGSASIAIGKYFHWENSLTYAKADRQTSLDATDETGISKIEDSDLADVLIEEAVIERIMAHSQIRYFPTGGYFNLSLGYAISQLQASIKGESLSTGSVLEENYDVYYGATSLSIGNLWTFKRAFVGMDWVGTMNSNWSTEKHEINSVGPQTTAMQEYSRRFEDSALFCARSGGSILLVFTAGIIL